MMADSSIPESPPSEALLEALAGNPAQMADLIGALHRRVRDATTLVDLMGRICREAVRLFDDVAWAGVTAQFGGRPLTGSSTDERVLVVDEGQYAGNDGPCLRAMRTDTAVSMTLDQVTAIWPLLGAAAARVGVHSFLALPLHADGESVGSLNMYGPAAVVAAPDPDLLAVLVEYINRGLADFRNGKPQPTTDAALRAAVSGWVVVEQAVGVLMAVYGFSADYALDVLVDQAQDWGRTLTEQAADVIARNSGAPDPQI